MPRTKEENEKVRERTMQGLLKSAIKVFAKKGYHGATMEDVAKVANVSKGLAYHYFKSKEELLVHLAKERLEEFAPLLKGLEEIRDPKERFCFSIDFVFEELQNKSDKLRFFNALYLHGDGVKAISKAMRKYKERFQRQLLAEEKLMRDLGFDDPKTEATFLRSALQGISLEYLLGPEEYPLEEMRALLIRRYIV